MAPGRGRSRTLAHPAPRRPFRRQACPTLGRFVVMIARASRFLLLSLIGLLALGATPAAVFAAPSTSTAAPAFVLVPQGEDGPYFAETLKPGEQKTLTAGLGNSGDEPAVARTYAA